MIHTPASLRAQAHHFSPLPGGGGKFIPSAKLREMKEEAEKKRGELACAYGDLRGFVMEKWVWTGWNFGFSFEKNQAAFLTI